MFYRLGLRLYFRLASTRNFREIYGMILGIGCIRLWKTLEKDFPGVADALNLSRLTRSSPGRWNNLTR